MGESPFLKYRFYASAGGAGTKNRTSEQDTGCQRWRGLLDRRQETLGIPRLGPRRRADFPHKDVMNGHGIGAG